MQVEVRLINNFHTTRPVCDKAITSKNLTIQQSEAIYSILDKALKELTKKDPDFWIEKPDVPNQRMFNLELDNKTVEASYNNEDWELAWDANWGFQL